MKSFLTAYKVAKLLDVDRATVSRWIQHGKIPGVIQDPQSRNGTKKWWIPISSYERLSKSLKSNEGN
jgi:predicted site-specific integrase-resolvase